MSYFGLLGCSTANLINLEISLYFPYHVNFTKANYIELRHE